MKALIVALVSMVALSASAADTAPMAAPAANKPAAAAPAAKPAAGMTKSLYDRLGGKPAITAVVDDFVPRAAADPKVNFFRNGKYKNVNVPQLKTHLVNFISMATGGPNEYKGRDMVSAHTGMKITDAEFGAIAADLQATLAKFKVPAKETNELMTIVGSTKAQIVGK